MLPENNYHIDDPIWREYWQACEMGDSALINKEKQELEENLWKSFNTARESSDPERIRETRGDLIVWYTSFKNSLARRIAWMVITTRNLQEQDIDDLINDCIAPEVRSTHPLAEPDPDPDKEPKGLIYAIEHFDRGRGVKFSTYAHWQIKGAMLKSRTVMGDVTPYEENLIRKFKKLTRRFEEEHGRTPSIKELAEFGNLSMLEARNMWLAWLHAGQISLEEYEAGLDPDGGDENQVEDRDAQGPEVQLDSKEKMELLIRFINQLRTREKQVFLNFYQLGMSHKEIAEAMKITPENSRQLLLKAKRALQKWFEEKE
jgi:RNA polymerase sigma factor for flagellar operon FliA